MLRFSGAAVLAAMVGSPAIAAELPNGVYDCTIGPAFLGNIKIEGGTFSGPAFDGKYEGSYPFQVTEGGTIDWGGPLGGISQAGTVVSSVLGEYGNSRIGFNITIQNERGNFQQIGCAPQ